VHLNTDTSITVKEGPGGRYVILERGEVFTVVRHDEVRPFHLAVGHVVIEDLGTQFDVSTDEGKTRITVIDGKVRILERRDDGRVVDPLVASSGGSKREGAVLEVGDVAKIEEHGDGTATVYKGPRDIAEVTRRIQWLQGQLDFTGQSLAEVVREINRYNRLQLVIDDPRIAGLRIGGRFDVRDLNGFVDSLRVRDRIRATVTIRDRGSTQEIHLRGPSDRKGQR
jgi:transmembrane sensor